MAFENQFKALLGRAPSERERDNLRRVRDVLELSENDGLWMVLFALQYYDSAYEEMPGKIQNASEAILKDFRDTAQRVADAAAAKSRDSLAQLVADAAGRISYAQVRKSVVRWSAIAIAVAATSIIMLSFYFHRTAHAAGYAEGVAAGYKDARVEASAATWGATPEGRLAFQLAELGGLRKLATCDFPDWKRVNDICYPQPRPDGMMDGWRIP